MGVSIEFNDAKDKSLLKFLSDLEDLGDKYPQLIKKMEIEYVSLSNSD